ncbi:hypothetical protein JCM33374_g5602 [Metschnikowia sp. JCM 33374]|nr:hypothetical protein JCM33374_g5602 [Metschnikowia sp. JCM 33374]
MTMMSRNPPGLGLRLSFAISLSPLNPATARSALCSRPIVAFPRPFASSATSRQPPGGQQYEQIPEYLKIHMFTPELEILRHDELRAPFKHFSGDFILKLLDQRANEIRLDTANSNPASRLNNDNVVRFMKVSSRLKQLFNLNGGNTEVLDAVLHSQSALNAFEAKLAAKKSAKSAKQSILHANTRAADLYAPGPYIQIPESLGLHEFAEELSLFRSHELKKNFSDLSAQNLLHTMEKRLKEVYDDVSDAPHTQGVCKQNLVRFYNLFPKLQKLLAWNGGTTAVLDTLLESHNVFKSVDEKIQSKRARTNTREASSSLAEPAPYTQIPDDVFLEEYSEELKEVRKKLGSSFSSVSSTDILKAVSELAELNAKWDKGLVFSKLYRNLAILFAHNDGQTFVLDNVLVNSAVFDKLESRLVARGPRTQRQDQEPIGLPDSKTEPDLEEESQTKYRGSDHVIEMLSSLNSSENGRQNPREEFLHEERTFKSALAQAMSKEERNVYEKDPEEYEEIINLTSDKIRNNYRHASDAVKHKQIPREEIEKYLKKIKDEKHIADQDKWREQTAFEWSKMIYKNNRSFEAKNFFNPILSGGKGNDFPLFPGTGKENEYLILTSNGEKFRSPTNPLGMNHVPEDMFAVLQTLSETELGQFQKNVEKLRKKGWTIIGSGRTKGMLVLSREVNKRRSKVWRALKDMSASHILFWLVSSFCIWQMVAYYTWFDEKDERNTEEKRGEKNKDIVADVSKSKGSLWKGIFWK